MSRAGDYWSFFAGEAERAQSPLYARLALAIGSDEDLTALAAHARKGQPHANMLFGAVHFLLLRGADHPLKAYYPTLGGGRAADDGDVFACFSDFVARRRESVKNLIEARTTNTNEVGRSALLHPGFRSVAAAAEMPLALIEIGPSAGLNMIWDSYGVRYFAEGATKVEIDRNAALVIDCEMRGDTLPPAGPAPQIASRVGLELNPNRLDEAENRDWLRALVWPEHVTRQRRLEAAMVLAQAAAPPIIYGDALELLMPQLRAIPEQCAPCIYHTIVTYQFSDTMRQVLADLLTVAGLRRPVFRLGFEWAGGHDNLLTLTRYHDGAIEERVLAKGHPHGGWIEWLA